MKQTDKTFENITDQFHFIVNSAHGVYSYQYLLNSYDVDGITDEVRKTVLNGPSESEHYWDDVQDILDYGHIWHNGKRYDLTVNDGDIYAIPSWIDYPEEFWEWWII